jgi:peptide/nickel transport system permease protein
MMGCFLLITVSVVVTNLLVDLLYPLVDPRIVNPAARKRAEAAQDSEDVQALPVGGTVA